LWGISNYGLVTETFSAASAARIRTSHRPETVGEFGESHRLSEHQQGDLLGVPNRPPVTASEHAG
jgi:hypothetical protein